MRTGRPRNTSTSSPTSRRHDWAEDKALSTEIKDLGARDVSLNLVRVVGESNENLAVSDLAGFVEVAAAKVPVTFGAKVSNFGTREASDVAVGILVDGNRLPATKVIPKIAAGRRSICRSKRSSTRPVRIACS